MSTKTFESWIERHPRFRWLMPLLGGAGLILIVLLWPAAITQNVWPQSALTRILSMVLASAVGFLIAAETLWLLWWKTGRFKWFLIGLLTALVLNMSKHNENNWIYVCAIIILLAFRDENRRGHLVNEAVEEARSELRTETGNLVDSDRAIDVTVRRIGKKLWEIGPSR